MDSFNPADFNIAPEEWSSAIRFLTPPRKEELESIIKENYPIIKAHFSDKRGDIISDKDLDDICTANMWKWIRIYELGAKPNGKDMRDVFTTGLKDFGHYNKEIVVKLLRERHPKDYSKQCQFILNMSEKEVADYVSFLEMMYNK